MKITIPFVIKDANIVYSNVPENDYELYSPDGTYAFGQHVIVTGVDIHQVYKSAHTDNHGNNPLLDNLDNPLHWSLVGATNRYKMFDTYTSSQTVQAENINFQIKDLGSVNTLAFPNIDAADITVVQRDTLGNTIYSRTQNLTSYATLAGYYDYYFTPFFRKNIAVFEDIPPLRDAVFEVTITGVGAVKLGSVVGGYAYDIANINHESSIDNKDFSVKTQLPTGEYYFAKGANATVADFIFTFKNEKFDLLQRLLQKLPATPALYIGSTKYETTTMYGIVLGSPARLTYEKHSECRMRVESLI